MDGDTDPDDIFCLLCHSHGSHIATNCPLRSDVYRSSIARRDPVKKQGGIDECRTELACSKNASDRPLKEEGEDQREAIPIFWDGRTYYHKLDAPGPSVTTTHNDAPKQKRQREEDSHEPPTGEQDATSPDPTRAKQKLP